MCVCVDVFGLLLCTVACGRGGLLLPDWSSITISSLCDAKKRSITQVQRKAGLNRFRTNWGGQTETLFDVL